MEINLSTELFGHKLQAPLIIESMTGGTTLAAKINGTLAKVAERLGIGMGVGSQRAAIEDEKLAYTYRVAREAAPSIPLFANLGCPQISREEGLDRAKKAVDMIDATGLFIHLNALQESVQFEGETEFRKMTSRIGELASELKVPVLVKETGAGIAMETARALEHVGIKGINVSGLGGTSWAGVEYYRARAKLDKLQMEIGNNLLGLGNPNRPEYRRSCQLNQPKGLCFRWRQEWSSHRKGYRAGSTLRRPCIAHAQVRIIGRRGRNRKPDHGD